MKFTDQNRQTAIPLFVVAAVTFIMTTLLLLAYVLPTYYSVDPTGWGAKLGVTGKPAATEIVGITNNAHAAPKQPEAQIAGSSNAITLTSEPQMDDPLSVREDNVELTILPKQSLDYRLAMERDYDLDYFWTANGKTLSMELRGEPNDNKAAGKTFAKLTHSSGKGFFIIPFNGQFGWHWQNKTDQPITLRLHTKGHYQIAGQLNMDVPK